MSYSIIGTGNVGLALAAFFVKAGIEVALANTRGPKAVEPMAKKLGGKVAAISSDHEDASGKVASLAGELGFAPIEVGKIGEGGRLIQAPNALVFQDLIKFKKD
jgi:predicted dinucleotide-binding enzyme